jgi:hypothetical protein
MTRLLVVSVWTVSGVLGTCPKALLTVVADRIRAAPRIAALMPNLVALLDDGFKK